MILAKCPQAKQEYISWPSHIQPLTLLLRCQQPRKLWKSGMVDACHWEGSGKGTCHLPSYGVQ